MTALYLTSFVLQNSASLRFFGTFISGAALPVKLTTPLIVAVPIAPPGPGSFWAGVALAAALGGGLAAVVFTGGGVGLGSSGQPTPIVRAVRARAASEARSRRRCMR